MTDLHLGKAAPVYDSRTLRFADYLQESVVLPKLPHTFGHDTTISQSGWGMLGNDRAGDCVWAGAAHETMLWTAERGSPATFSDESVLSDYTAVTGYDPNDPNTDRGTAVLNALNYRRKTGVLDAHGNRHTIAAFAYIEPGHWDHFLAALYLFGAVGIGIEFPASAMDQFNQGKYWSVVPGAQIEGGHYIPCVARRGVTRLITWSKEIGMTKAFFEKYCDEAYAILSPEVFDPSTGHDLEGFRLDELQADLRLVT